LLTAGGFIYKKVQVLTGSDRRIGEGFAKKTNMRRPAIGMNRILAYDGERVTFGYKGKTDGQEKTETVSGEGA